jgi:hypothetical protein
MAFGWLRRAFRKPRDESWRAGNRDRFTTLFVKER